MGLRREGENFANILHLDSRRCLVLLVGILVTAYLTGATDMDLVISSLTVNPGLISTTLRLGIAAFNSFGVSGSMFQYVSNGTAKGILFIVVGAVMLQVRGERSLSKLGGLAGKMPITATAAFIGSLTLAGLPATNGFLSEFFLFQGGFVRATDTASEYRLVIAALGIIATALTAGYSLMAMKKIFFGTPNSDTSDVKEAPWTITFPLIALSIVTIILGIYPEPILGRLLSAARSTVGS